MHLYDYWRSSAGYRVRIALHLKGLDFETTTISLLDGEQSQPPYLAINPQGLVPFLADGEVAIGQSLAILEYLEERYPQVPLLPQTPPARAAVRQLANTVACDIHPLCNLRVLDYLRQALAVDEAARSAWYHHWVSLGLAAIEARLAELESDDFCVGNSPTLADVCLVPQVFNARRFHVSLDPYPRIRRIDGHCGTLEPFQRAAPERQPRR